MNLANKITTFRIALVPVFVLVLTPMPQWLVNNSHLFQIINKNSMAIATGIFILGAITDKLDGYVARKFNQITKLGCFLDPLADKQLVISALIFLVQENMIAGWIAMIIIGREIAVTGLRLIAMTNQKVLAADRYGKAKLVLQVITIMLFLMNGYPFKLFVDFPISDAMMSLTVVITVVSGINYFIRNKAVFYENGKLAV